MIDRRALPGFLACAGGLMVSVLAMVFQQAWLVAAAGLCAVTAGVFTLGLADRLRDSRLLAEQESSRASKSDVERDQMAARAARFEAEALIARKPPAAPRSAVPVPVAGGGGVAAQPPPFPGHREVANLLDPETGLFNEAFFLVTLEKRVASARRGLRPLAVVLIDAVTGVSSASDASGPRPVDPTVVADVLTHTLRDADSACRLGNGLFALILEDTPEAGAVWVAERLRRRLVETQPDQTLWAGVACYPAHAFDMVQLLDQADRALASARDWRQDRIEVAAAPD